MDDVATRAGALVTLCATLAMLAACASGSDPQGGGLATFDGGMDDASESGDEAGGPTSSGDGDGDPTSSGDGDGDPTSSGDGDGDPTSSGDGDGDPTSSGDGDGDGDPTSSGDGDGDPTSSGDGDGDSTTTGDGDGDGDIVPVDMIDNFEDGNGALIPSGGRQGYWYTYNDESVGASQTPASDVVLPQSGGASGTGLAMHTSGGGFTEWGAGIGVDLNNVDGEMGIKMTWDASGYTGIVVMAKGSGEVRASVQIETTIPLAEGGTCAADCDPHGQTLVLSDDWQQFILPFGQLAQEGWGTPAAWDASTLVGIQFKAAPNLAFDFWIDEIGFY